MTIEDCKDAYIPSDVKIITKVTKTKRAKIRNMTENNYVQVNKMISLYLLLWFLLLKSGGTEEASFDEDLCSIRFYSIQYFKGSAWTLVSGGGWEFSEDTLYSHPIGAGKFVPKSIRTYGDSGKCKQVWRICPFGAISNNRITKCRKLRHGQSLPSVTRGWGWNDKFLGHVRSLKKVKKVPKISQQLPPLSLPHTVPMPMKETTNSNIEINDVTDLEPPNEEIKLKEMPRSTSTGDNSNKGKPYSQFKYKRS